MKGLMKIIMAILGILGLSAKASAKKKAKVKKIDKEIKEIKKTKKTVQRKKVAVQKKKTEIKKAVKTPPKKKPNVKRYICAPSSVLLTQQLTVPTSLLPVLDTVLCKYSVLSASSLQELSTSYPVETLPRLAVLCKVSISNFLDLLASNQI